MIEYDKIGAKHKAAIMSLAIGKGMIPEEHMEMMDTVWKRKAIIDSDRNAYLAWGELYQVWNETKNRDAVSGRARAISIHFTTFDSDIKIYNSMPAIL